MFGDSPSAEPHDTFSLQTASATAIHPDEVFVETEASKKEITQEYDPTKPNDYSVVNALIQKRKREKKYEEEVRRGRGVGWVQLQGGSGNKGRVGTRGWEGNKGQGVEDEGLGGDYKMYF